MDMLLLILICGGGYLFAYHTYGRFLAKKILKLNKGVAVPCLIMLVITSWAMIKNEMNFIRQENRLLVTIGTGIFLPVL